MNKKLIRLTESDLHRIVKESVNRALREGIDDGDELYNEIMHHIEMARDLCNQYKSYVKGYPEALEWAFYAAEQLSSLASGSLPMERR